LDQHKIHQIPGHLESFWLPDASAILDVWTDFNVSLEQYEEAVLDKGIAHAAAQGAHAWIVDTSAATGLFSREIQTSISSKIFARFAETGIRDFITIAPANTMAKLTVQTFSRKAGPHGIQLSEVESLDAALDILRQTA